MPSIRRIALLSALLAAPAFVSACSDATGPSSNAVCESQGSNTCLNATESQGSNT